MTITHYHEYNGIPHHTDFNTGDVILNTDTFQHYRATGINHLEPLRVASLLIPNDGGALLKAIDHEQQLTHAEAWQELVMYRDILAVWVSPSQMGFVLIVG